VGYLAGNLFYGLVSPFASIASTGAPPGPVINLFSFALMAVGLALSYGRGMVQNVGFQPMAGIPAKH
jgi:hypothetical protein